MVENFAGLKNLVSWFQSSKRIFPWRTSKSNEVSAYAVWISEVMLQQTRAEVVIPYFQRFIKHFPNIASLAQAKEEDVIKAWEGLGYYARARRLLQAASYLVTHHGGELPASTSLLKKIPGFGPYTAGAVASFAFHCKAAAVDGNVLRFLSRYLLVEKDVGKAKVQEEFQRRTLDLLPDHEPWVAMEAMIELGATICKKVPECSHCPLQRTCQGYHKGMTHVLPIKPLRKKTIRLVRKVMVITCKEEVLLCKVPPGRVMAGLFEFPLIERVESLPSSEIPHLLTSFDDIHYSFTHYHVTLSATLWEIKSHITWPECTWALLTSLRQIPFSSGHRRLCEKMLDFLGIRH